MTNTRYPNNATFMAHTAHAGRNRADDSCRLCVDHGAVRVPWDDFVEQYPDWNKDPRPAHTADALMRYEDGDLSPAETLALFGDLLRTGTVWNLQGSYVRAAEGYILAGLLTPEGQITDLGRLCSSPDA